VSEGKWGDVSFESLVAHLVVVFFCFVMELRLFLRACFRDWLNFCHRFAFNPVVVYYLRV
jgi:hypothetical protein